MRSTAQSLGSTWKDPQYHSFIASIDGMSKTMKKRSSNGVNEKKFNYSQKKFKDQNKSIGS